MKRIGDLWPEVTCFSNLLMAFDKAAAGKRKRPDVASFRMNLEWELLQLQRELRDSSYQPGPYHTFTIQDPKPRLISAAPFRDRVVHHALTQVIEPIFERRFSKDSFACRKGMGTHKALARAKSGVRRFPYALKCDIRKYFPSIDHQILKQQLARVIKCRSTLDLAGRIIDGSNPQPENIRYFPGDDLFTPYERRRGLPLGNQTSQFFANVYLDPLDQFVTRQLRPALYVRYVDDFLLFAESKDGLREMKARLEARLGGLRLEIHPGKSRLYRCCDGLRFLGWRLFPERSRLARENVAGFRQRMRQMEAEYRKNLLAWDSLRQRVQSWIAHAAQGDTWMLREKLLARFAFWPRHAAANCAGAVGTTIQ